jgi:hypothetical protein
MHQLHMDTRRSEAAGAQISQPNLNAATVRGATAPPGHHDRTVQPLVDCRTWWSVRLFVVGHPEGSFNVLPDGVPGLIDIGRDLRTLAGDLTQMLRKLAIRFLQGGQQLARRCEELLPVGLSRAQARRRAGRRRRRVPGGIGEDQLYASCLRTSGITSWPNRLTLARTLS